MKLEYFLALYIKVNSKMDKSLNARPETIKLLEEKHRQNTDINHSKILFDPPSKVMKIKTNRT